MNWARPLGQQRRLRLPGLKATTPGFSVLLMVGGITGAWGEGMGLVGARRAIFNTPTAFTITLSVLLSSIRGAGWRSGACFPDVNLTSRTAAYQFLHLRRRLPFQSMEPAGGFAPHAWLKAGGCAAIRRWTTLFSGVKLASIAAGAHHLLLHRRRRGTLTMYTGLRLRHTADQPDSAAPSTFSVHWFPRKIPTKCCIVRFCLPSESGSPHLSKATGKKMPGKTQEKTY